MNKFAWITLFFTFSSLAAQTTDTIPGADTIPTPVVIKAVKIDSLPRVYVWNPILIQPKLESGDAPLMTIGKYTLADSAELARNLHATVGQRLREVASLSAKAYGPGSSVTPNFRGTGAGHTGIYWNGLPLDQPMLGLQDLSLLPGVLFQKTGLLFGANSLNLGTGGIGGAITLSNTYGRVPGHVGLELSQEVGSFGDQRTSVSLTASPFRRLVLRTSGIYQQARNDYSYHLGPSLEGQISNADARQYHVMQGVEYQLAGNSYLTAEAWLYDMERGLPPTVISSDQGERQRDRGQRFALRYSKRWRKFDLRVRSAWYADRLLYTHQVGGIHAESYSGALALQADIGRTQFSVSPHQVGLQGASLRFRQSFAETSSYPGRITRNELTGHLALQSRVGAHAVLKAIWRPQMVDNRLMPAQGSIAWVYTGEQHEWKGPVKFFSSWYVQANSNTHVPGLNDLYWVPGGNPDLLPERSLGLEAGHLLLPIWSYQNRLSFSQKTSVYANSVRNWIQWTPDTTAIWYAENVGQVWNVGFETQSKFQWNRTKGRTWLLADYAYTRSIYGLEGSQLIYTPAHVLRGRLEWEYKGYRLAWDQDFTSRRFTLRDGSDWLPAYSTAHASIGKTIVRPRWCLDLQVEVRNVLNAQYSLVAWRPMPPRSLHLRAIFKLPSKY